MADKSPQKKDLTIEQEPLKIGDVTTTRSILKIPCDNKTDKFFRIFRTDLKKPFFQRSSRLKTLEPYEAGFKTIVTGYESEIAGKQFELREVLTKEVLLTGKIVFKPAKVEAVPSAAANG